MVLATIPATGTASDVFFSVAAQSIAILRKRDGVEMAETASAMYSPTRVQPAGDTVQLEVDLDNLVNTQVSTSLFLLHTCFMGGSCEYSKTTKGIVEQSGQCVEKGGRLGGAHFREHSKEAYAWAEKELGDKKKNWRNLEDD